MCAFSLDMSISRKHRLSRALRYVWIAPAWVIEAAAKCKIGQNREKGLWKSEKEKRRCFDSAEDPEEQWYHVVAFCNRMHAWPRETPQESMRRFWRAIIEGSIMQTTPPVMPPFEWSSLRGICVASLRNEKSCLLSKEVNVEASRDARMCCRIRVGGLLSRTWKRCQIWIRASNERKSMKEDERENAPVPYKKNI